MNETRQLFRICFQTFTGRPPSQVLVAAVGVRDANKPRVIRGRGAVGVRQWELFGDDGRPENIPGSVGVGAKRPRCQTFLMMPNILKNNV